MSSQFLFRQKMWYRWWRQTTFRSMMPCCMRPHWDSSSLQSLVLIVMTFILLRKHGAACWVRLREKWWTNVRNCRWFHSMQRRGDRLQKCLAIPCNTNCLPCIKSDERITLHDLYRHEYLYNFIHIYTKQAIRKELSYPTLPFFLLRLHVFSASEVGNCIRAENLLDSLEQPRCCGNSASGCRCFKQLASWCWKDARTRFFSLVPVYNSKHNKSQQYTVHVLQDVTAV